MAALASQLITGLTDTIGISIHPWEVCHPEMNVSGSPAELGNVQLAV